MNFGKYLQRYPPINFWFCIDQNCFLLSFFYQSIKKYLNPPSKKDPLNLWNSFRYTTMLHVIKKNPTTKEKQTRNLLLCKMIVWFFTKIRSYLLIVIFATLQHPFFPFYPLTPSDIQWSTMFLKSHLKLLCSYDFTKYISRYKEQDVWFSFCLTILPQRTEKTDHGPFFFSTHLLIQVWKGWIWLFFKFGGKLSEIGEA